jgi:nitroreductase
MVRSYDPDRTIDPNLLSELLRLAVRAPSAGNTQGWQFLVLDDITSRNLFWETTSDGDPDSWLLRMRTAPALVLCLSDKNAYLDRYAEPDKGWTDRDENRWPAPYWHIDTGMAAMTLLLAATDSGLGACFFGVPGDRWSAVRAAFEIPERLDIVGVVSLGYPAADRKSPSLKRGRRPQTEVVSWNRYSAG